MYVRILEPSRVLGNHIFFSRPHPRCLFWQAYPLYGLHRFLFSVFPFRIFMRLFNKQLRIIIPLYLTTLKYFCLSHGDKRVFSFKIILNVLVTSFRCIWISMLWVYGHYKYYNSFCAGFEFRRQNLTLSKCHKFWYRAVDCATLWCTPVWLYICMHVHNSTALLLKAAPWDDINFRF